MLIETKCGCGNFKNIYVTRDAYSRWRGGDLIQRCFPELSDDDRERILTGICPNCWECIGDDDDDEFEDIDAAAF